MKLFLLDEKHNLVHYEMELPAGMDLNGLDAVIRWLDKIEITNRYKRLVVAQDYRYIRERDEFGDEDFKVEFENKYCSCKGYD